MGLRWASLAVLLAWLLTSSVTGPAVAADTDSDFALYSLPDHLADMWRTQLSADVSPVYLANLWHTKLNAAVNGGGDAARERRKATNSSVEDPRPGPVLSSVFGDDAERVSSLGALSLWRQTAHEDSVNLMRRQLMQSWRSFGANVPFSKGPTLSSFNQSYFRYDSIPLLPAFDLRSVWGGKFVTPIQPSFSCSNCFVMAAVDAVVMATAIAANQSAIPGSVQQFCDCNPNGCCQGGWPEDAFSWLASQGTVPAKTSYPYFAADNRNCTLPPTYPVAGFITGWERVPIFDQQSLMQAVQVQPVLVYISAFAPDFLAYSSTAPGTAGFYVYDGNCSQEVNHVMLVIGFNTSAPVPYWILKNTWPSWGWGDQGYMYIAMYDGPGMCGMLTVPPLYPINYPKGPQQFNLSSVSNSSGVQLNNNDAWWNWFATNQTFNACANVINPCGAGQCYTNQSLARCICPKGFVEVVGAPTSKCVDQYPCNNSAANPCGAGTCLDVGEGSYICGCSPGYTIGSQAGGSLTCVPIVQGTTSSTYFTVPGDTCDNLLIKFSMKSSAFSQLNPNTKCTGKKLVPGTVLSISTSATTFNCNQTYSIRSGDTCNRLQYAMDTVSDFFNSLNSTWWNTTKNISLPTLLFTVSPLPTTSAALSYKPTTLLTLNPGINCNSLFVLQLLCVKAPPAPSNSGRCQTTYTTVKKDTCTSVQAAYNLNTTYFAQLNPGLKCKGSLSPGTQICVALTAAVVTSGNCTQYYTVQQGDSCAQMWNAANLTRYQFLYINPGLQCQTPYLFVGEQVCINSPLLTNINDPSFITYTVQPGDTLATIQAAFSAKCTANSTSLQSIADRNSISDFTKWLPPPATIIVIPCVPKIGASCGCIPSLTVCGADFTNYPSYCDATCNFASPIASGSCTACESACALRWGMTPNPTSACDAGYICPYPAWTPTYSDAQLFTACGANTLCPNCYCSYRQTMCNSLCQGTASYTSCYNLCFGAHVAPCAGPSTSYGSLPSWPCSSVGTCPGTPCYSVKGGGYATCTGYWQNYWSNKGFSFPPSALC